LIEDNREKGIEPIRLSEQLEEERLAMRNIIRDMKYLDTNRGDWHDHGKVWYCQTCGYTYDLKSGGGECMDCKHEFRIFRDTDLDRSGYLSFFCIHCLLLRKVKKEFV